MKTYIKLSAFFFLAILLLGSIDSCKKENNFGQMTIKMTDAPADFQQVNVEVIGLEVNHETKGWINLEIKSGVYNLLELQNNVSVILADKVILPEGKISQLRLILGENNTIVTATDIISIKVPSGSESGLKINLDTVIIPNQTIVIILDFDVNTSIVQTGNGKFLLKPVLKIKSINQF